MSKKELDSGQRIIFKSPLFPIFIALFIAGLYLYSTLYFQPVRIAGAKFNDYFFRLRLGLNYLFNKEEIKPKDIVLITIDEESYERLEKKWPWGRDVFADFLDKISKYRPKVVALDFALYGESPDNPEADVKLADAIKRSGNVIIASVYGKEKLYLGPYDILAKASNGYGITGGMRDDDGAIRRAKVFALILTLQKGGDVSFEAKAAAAYLNVPYDKIRQEEGCIVVGSGARNITIPTDENGSFLINYLCDKDDIETIPIWRVMANKVTPEKFKDKLVLVSQTGEIFHDQAMTPLRGYKPGGLIIANILNSIITSSYIVEADPRHSALSISIVYLLALLLFYKKSVMRGAFILIFMVAACMTVSFALFLRGMLYPAFDVIVLLSLLFLGITFYKYAIVVLEGHEVKKLAITDSLTSLYTHRYFRLLLEHTAKTASDSGARCALIAVKLQNLDNIVKETDFDKGQDVQRKIAKNIQEKLPKNGYAAYMGTGEFGMLLPRVGTGEALGIAGSMRDKIRDTDFDIEKNGLKPVVSIGVASIDNTPFPKTGAELIRGARAAMLRAREIGCNKVCRFNPNIDISALEYTDETIIKERSGSEFTFLAIDLEERNKELEELLYQLSITQRDLEEAHFETLRSLIVALEQKDPCTAGHSERVGEYAEKIGRKLRMQEEEIKILRQEAILHDIGKVGIPPDILRKEGTLTLEERQVIELHPEFSTKILSTSKYFNKHLNAIRGHHERLDGSGYPRGLRGSQISLDALIIAVCDVYDAMSNNRPYRKALSSKEALGEMQLHPEKYNQKVVLALEEILKSEHKI